MIPPECGAEFVPNMEDACFCEAEDVLETYQKPYDLTHPVICMDEQPVQLIKDVKVPIEETINHTRRVDYEYERAGVAVFCFAESANIFILTEPLAGWCGAFARETKTKVD